MIHLTAESKILLATQPADFRCGIDGLGVFQGSCHYLLNYQAASFSGFR